MMLVCVLAAAPASVRAQEVEPGSKQAEGIGKKQYDKMAAKKARKEKKEVAREEKHLLREHLRHQDKDTQKRMKRNQRNAFKNGNGQPREPFLRRLFTHKH
jgi:hypothetical protein